MNHKDHYLKTELFSLIRNDVSIFEFLRQGSFDGMWYWDLERPENEWMDKKFWQTLGYDPNKKQHLASDWQELIFPEDLKLALDNFERHSNDPACPYDQIVRYRHSDGHTVWIRCRGIAIRDKSGKPVRMLGIHTDESEVFRLSASIEKLKQRFELATEAANIGFWEMDLVKNDMIWDDRMFRIYQRNKDSFSNSYADWVNCVHPDDLQIAQQEVKQSIENCSNFKSDFRILWPDGQVRYIRSHAQVLCNKNGKAERIVGANWDISEHKNMEEHIREMALTDSLTGLPNRNLLDDRLLLATARSKRSGEIFAVCMMDLDGFKLVNDTYGHEAGDKLLQEVSRRLQQVLRPEDTVLRLGGDEFVLLVGGIKVELECEVFLKRVLNTIAQPFSIQDSTVNVTASIGATFYPNDKSVGDILLRHADQAMYKAKSAGKNMYYLFDPTLESRHKENLNIINRIKKALKLGQFEIYYQPQVDCAIGKVVGVEALIRWNHPVLGLRMPGEFLPLVENDELVIDIGNWVIETAIAQLDVWLKQGLELNIGINISSKHLLHGAIEEKIDELSRKYSAETLRHIELEVVETTALEDMKVIGELVNSIQSKGVRFALDDFGTGFSSLAHLKYLSVDTLKIDRTFVRDMLVDPGDLAIIQGVLGLSKAFRSTTVAEGVESIEQTMLLLEQGCEIMQGYALSAAMPANLCREWIENFTMNPIWNAAKNKYPSRKDFELLLLEVSHRHWQEEVKTFIRKSRRAEANAEMPTDYAQCRSTAWYQNGGIEKYGNLPEFHELDLLHHNIHRLGKEIAQLVLENVDEKKINLVFDRLELATEKYVSAIRRLRDH
jgi:diguanylate cyclase (GGDEF)-like protein